MELISPFCLAPDTLPKRAEKGPLHRVAQFLGIAAKECAPAEISAVPEPEADA